MDYLGRTFEKTLEDGAKIQFIVTGQFTANNGDIILTGEGRQVSLEQLAGEGFILQ